MGPQRKLGIYVGFVSPSIIYFMEPITGNLLQARFANCFFDETIFPMLEIKTRTTRSLDFSASRLALSQPDPRTTDCEREVERILHLRTLAENLPDSFNDAIKVTKSYIPIANAPI